MTTETTTAAFGAGSVSLGLHPTGGSAAEFVASVLDHAVLAERAGFAGVTLAEHHGGYPGYLPNPLLAAGWILDALHSAWAAAAPLLLGLRPAPLVVEDAAWTATRHPGRFGLALAPGYVEDDFATVGADYATRATMFRERLAVVTSALVGNGAAVPLGRDSAVLDRADAPVSVLAAAAGPVGARRAAEAGAGILVGAFDPPARVRELVEAYAAAGGTGPRVLIRRIWLGTPDPAALAAMLGGYTHRSGEKSFLSNATPESVLHSADPVELADLIVRAREESGATALNLRIVLPGAPDAEVREQIARIGDHVLPRVRP